MNKEFWLVMLTCALGLLLAYLLGDLSVSAAQVEPVATVEPCLPIGSAEGQQLYFCESNYAPDCVWDPSPGLGAGVVDCDW